MAHIINEMVGWHPGEAALHNLLNKGVHQENPTVAGLLPAYGYRAAASPLIAFGALDRKGRPWTTIWGGERQFARPIGPNLLGVQSLVDLDYDPVIDALFGGDGVQHRKGTGELLRPGPEAGEVMAGLSINLETRDRVKLAGRMAAGMVTTYPTQPEQGDGTVISPGRVGKVQLAMLVNEALGNCPKYLNKKIIRPHMPRPQLLHASDTAPLPEAALDLIRRADLFFLSSTNGKTMDTNYRGGPPGFLRVVSNAAASVDSSSTATTLIYPEFSGNRLYQTLGNLYMQPLVGVVVPDFETGSVLYLTGQTTILIDADAAAYMPHTKLAVRITVDQAILVSDGLPFRGSCLDYSPYNPPLRRLVGEIVAVGGDPNAVTTAEKRAPVATAVLAGRQELTPSIARFSFTLELPGGVQTGAGKNVQLWQAGQYARLDFGPELDMGWSHMRDEDPQSLNDDFIRTFTISSPPPPLAPAVGADSITLEMTLRCRGPATNLLWRHNVRGHLEIPVLGYGGDERFRITRGGCEDDKNSDSSKGHSQESSVFVATGVGITPLLAQAPGLLAKSGQGTASRVKLTVLWSLRTEDLPFAADSFSRISGLARHTTLFVTGVPNKVDISVQEEHQESIRRLREKGATVIEGRRIQENDVLNAGKDNGELSRTFFLCTGPALLRDLEMWLVGEDTVWESFDY